MGRLRPEVQPLTLLHTILAEKVPLYCNPFLSPCNEVNEQYYGIISSITRRNAISASIRNILIKGLCKYLNGRFPYPIIYLNLWNPYPFLYLKPEKGTPFGRSLPLWAIIGNTPPGQTTCIGSMNRWLTTTTTGGFFLTFFKLLHENRLY